MLCEVKVTKLKSYDAGSTFPENKPISTITGGTPKEGFSFDCKEVTLSPLTSVMEIGDRHYIVENAKGQFDIKLGTILSPTENEIHIVNSIYKDGPYDFAGRGAAEGVTFTQEESKAFATKLGIGIAISGENPVRASKWVLNRATEKELAFMCLWFVGETITKQKEAVSGMKSLFDQLKKLRDEQGDEGQE